MSASRQLVHIATSHGSDFNMVLDIAGGKLPVKGQVVPLVIRRASSSRAQSQSWRLTEVGVYRYRQEDTVFFVHRPSCTAVSFECCCIL